MCNDRGWSDEDYPIHESSEYMTELCTYIETKHEASVLQGQYNGQLRMVDGECCHTLTNIAQVVAGYQVHWGVRDSCYSRRVRIHNPMVTEPFTVHKH